MKAYYYLQLNQQKLVLQFTIYFGHYYILVWWIYHMYSVISYMVRAQQCSPSLALLSLPLFVSSASGQFIEWTNHGFVQLLFSSLKKTCTRHSYAHMFMNLCCYLERFLEVVISCVNLEFL